jgi:hypothetical protein
MGRQFDERREPAHYICLQHRGHHRDEHRRVAAARVDAVTRILAVHRVTAEPHRFYGTYGPHTDRSGTRRLRLSDPPETLAPLTQRIVPELLQWMQTGLDSVLGTLAGRRDSRPDTASSDADRNAPRRQRRESSRACCRLGPKPEGPSAGADHVRLRIGHRRKPLASRRCGPRRRRPRGPPASQPSC